MRRAPAFLAFSVLAAFCAACAPEPTHINSSPPRKTDRITAQYPNLFLQGDDEEQNEVTCELIEVDGQVLPVIIRDGNTTRRIDNIGVRPVNPDKYDTYIEIKILLNGLTSTGPVSSNSKRLYRGQRELWKWRLKPAEGMTKGSPVSFSFEVNVTHQSKANDVQTKVLRDIWRDSFSATVGPPASRVNAAIYSSPLFAAAGFVAFGTGLRRRRGLTGAKGEEEGEEEVSGVEPLSADVEDISAGSEAAIEEKEEEVSSTVYAPGQAGPGDGFMVQVFVHLPEHADSLDDIAKEADEDAKRRITSKLRKKIKRGTELAFYLLLPGLDIDEPAQSCVWDGEPARVQFGVNVPEDCRPRNIIGTVTVCENSVPIGHLKFKFKVVGDVSGEAHPASPEPVQAGNMTRYRQAFISYASQDRPEVLKRIQMLNLAKIKFFQDLLTLEPGEVWEKMLYEYIDKSDVFFLFWSKAASESEWVRREIEYAIKSRTAGAEPGPEIIPVIIEGPPAARPPAQLSFLHFNDKLLYFINSAEAVPKPLDN
jgi:hypothetical protein